MMVLRKFICVSVSAILLSGCASTQQASKIEKEEITGFLGHYSMLQKGGEGQALLRYVNPNVDFTQYKRVIIDPVTVWTQEKTDLGKLSYSERRKLADRFYMHLVNEVNKNTPTTLRMDPGVLRIQVALTDAQRSNAVLDTVSTIIPIGLALSTLKQTFTGKAAFTGSTNMEIKISDAMTGEVLAAAVDKRVGSKSLDGSFDEWGDTDAAMKYWSQLIGYRICQERGAKKCIMPEE